ncbi:hypothetical protein LC040_03225 [Bacillus tianshenii]|nr:hypothetical protein LC040_03225 [Bacillus tianshenii]
MSGCSCKKGHKDDCCFSCCKEKHLVQDKMCCEFTVTGGATAAANSIFVTDGAVSCENLVASGNIKNCSTTLSLTVEFVRGASAAGTGGNVIRTVVIPPGSCVTFTVARFDTIRGFGSGASATNPIDGEICITPRYKV